MSMIPACGRLEEAELEQQEVQCSIQALLSLPLAPSITHTPSDSPSLRPYYIIYGTTECHTRQVGGWEICRCNSNNLPAPHKSSRVSQNPQLHSHVQSAGGGGVEGTYTPVRRPLVAKISAAIDTLDYAAANPLSLNISAHFHVFL